MGRFILLVDESALALPEPITVERFVHVAWGMVHTLDESTSDVRPS